MQKLITLTVVTALSFIATGCFGQKSPEDLAPAVVEVPEGMETAVVGAGCFWCVEVFFEKQEGVHDAISGYAGGSEDQPTYYQVARGQTTHAEVVKVIYDPKVITYRELVDFFWTTHDATRGDGVWPDFGPQYRSILLHQDDQEKAAIEASRMAYEAKTNRKIATDIKALDTFYPAETYHQDYAKKNPSDPYVVGVLRKKLKKLGLK